MLLEKKVVVLYGAAGHIGQSVAHAFAREGARLFLTGRDLTQLEALTPTLFDQARHPSTWDKWMPSTPVRWSLTWPTWPVELEAWTSRST